MNFASAQKYARAAGVLILLSLVFGGIGEFWVPSRVIVSGDAAATMHNITANHTLFRIGFAAYLVEALCDVSLSLVFYVLLRPVNKDLALLAAFLGITGTALYAMAEAFYMAPTLLVGDAPYLRAFSPEQLQALTLLSLRFFSRTATVFVAFYGLATALRGFLIFRSGYLPRTLGVLMIVAGSAFIVQNALVVLAPAYASIFLVVPVLVATGFMMVWLLAKGIDARAWEVAAAAARASQ